MKLNMASRLTIIHVLALLCANAVAAQTTGEVKRRDCDPEEQSTYARYGARRCEVREQTLPAPPSALTIDARRNGGITVKGWGRNEMFVRARLLVWSDDAETARTIAERTRIEYRDNALRATNDDEAESGRVSVSYEVYVPRHTDLQLTSNNGGISVSDIESTVRLKVNNGGIQLARMAGDVRGGATNGGVSVTLDGATWRGAGLDVEAANGGALLIIPENYSARLETRTNWGKLKVEYPLPKPEPIGKELMINLGAGGPLVRVVATNGGVTIRRAAAM